MHETMEQAVEDLTKIGEGVSGPPKPAPGHHDSDEYPELDVQFVPTSAIIPDGSTGAAGAVTARHRHLGRGPAPTAMLILHT